MNVASLTVTGNATAGSVITVSVVVSVDESVLEGLLPPPLQPEINDIARPVSSTADTAFLRMPIDILLNFFTRRLLPCY